MKKCILFAIFFFSITWIRAQQQGNFTFDLSAAINLGTQIVTTRYTNEYNLSSYTSQDIALAKSVAAGLGFSYFLNDNCRISLLAYVNYNYTPTEQTTSSVYGTSTVGFGLAPKVTGMKRITDWLYWAPSVEFSLEYGNYREELSNAPNIETHYTGVQIAANPLAFDMRFSPKVSMTVDIISLAHAFHDIIYQTVSLHGTSNVLKFNGASVTLHLLL